MISAEIESSGLDYSTVAGHNQVEISVSDDYSEMFSTLARCNVVNVDAVNQALEQTFIGYYGKEANRQASWTLFKANIKSGRTIFGILMTAVFIMYFAVIISMYDLKAPRLLSKCSRCFLKPSLLAWPRLEQHS